MKHFKIFKFLYFYIFLAFSSSARRLEKPPVFRKETNVFHLIYVSTTRLHPVFPCDIPKPRFSSSRATARPRNARQENRVILGAACSPREIGPHASLDITNVTRSEAGLDVTEGRTETSVRMRTLVPGEKTRQLNELI